MASDFGINSADMGYDLANQLNNFNGTPISYDADGNMLKTPLGDGFGNLTYDSLNYLTDVTISGSAISYSYTYDAEGYRTSKTENGTTINFVVNPNTDLSQMLMSTKNGETTYYVYGLGLVSQENSEGYKLYHYDYRGSTTAITNLNGEVTDTVFYDPYGNVVSRTGTTDTPFLYVGKYGVETDNNGLYYMRARYYNPQIQRFINIDPIRDGYNWYGYVEGNSVNYNDPIGLLIYFENYVGTDLFNYSKDKTLKQSEVELRKKQREIVQQIMDALNELTDYVLIYEDGIVNVTNVLKNPEEISHPYGNMLIKTLDMGAYKIYDKGKKEPRGSSYYQKSKRIFIDPYDDTNSGINVIKNGQLCSDDINLNPFVIVLAHEMIHAYRDELKIFDYSESMVPNPYSNNDVLLEEIQTVGLGDWYENVKKNNHIVNGKFIITENDIRNELSSYGRIIYQRARY